MPREGSRGMRSFFEPKSIAVAGVSADPEKLGSIIFANLLANRRKGLLRASVYAINPAHDHIGDHPTFPDISALPQKPELLIVAVPEPFTLALVRGAAKAGVEAAIIVTSGYSEVGRSDTEREIGTLARKSGMRVMGPNTIGVVDTWSGVDSLFLVPQKRLPDGSQISSMRKPLKGGIVVVTQSGHLGQVLAEDMAANGVGIRALVGTGNQVDVSVEDVVEYFAAERETKAIAVYLEGVRDGRRFMRAVASAVESKPVVVFKVGKTDVGARAALTHTASLVGDYDVYRAAFRQAGATEAKSLQELIDFSVALSMLPRPGGNRLAILTNAGGVGAISADEAQRAGLRVEPFSPKVQGQLRSQFDSGGFVRNASLGNPIDLTATAPTTDFVKMTELMLDLEQVDMGLVLPTHQTPAIGHDIGERLTEVIVRAKKPVVASVIGDSELAAKIQQEFMSARIPSFPSPERAVRALGAVAAFSKLSGEAKAPLGARVPSWQGGKGPLSATEVSKLLRRYGIEEPHSLILRKREDLANTARLHFPVACKLLSKQLVHKKDIGGVVVGIRDVSQVETVYQKFRKLANSRKMSFDGMLVQEMVNGGVELILGSTRDGTFGPVVALGLGGTYAEIMREYVLAVAPVSPLQVKRLIAGTRINQILRGYRGGQSVSIDMLSRAVSRFSRILAENPSIGQVEVNPLIAKGKEMFAVDSRAIA